MMVTVLVMLGDFFHNTKSKLNHPANLKRGDAPKHYLECIQTYFLKHFICVLFFLEIRHQGYL